MNWYVLVILAGLYSDGTQDVYLYNDMGLESLEQCQRWVAGSSSAIRRDMQIKFDGKGVDRVFCIRKDRLEQFLLINESKQGTEA